MTAHTCPADPPHLCPACRAEAFSALQAAHRVNETAYTTWRRSVIELDQAVVTARRHGWSRSKIAGVLGESEGNVWRREARFKGEDVNTWLKKKRREEQKT